MRYRSRARCCRWGALRLFGVYPGYPQNQRALTGLVAGKRKSRREAGECSFTASCGDCTVLKSDMPTVTRTFDPEIGPLLHVGILPYQPLEIARQARTRGTRLALIDTGATVSYISDRLAVELRLPVIRRGTSDHAMGRHETNVYGADLVIYFGEHATSPRHFCARVDPWGMAMIHSQFELIIGRHILDLGTFTYEGAARQFTFSLPDDD